MTELSTITGEFTSPATEAAFQADRLFESRRHARILFILSAVLNAMFLFSDLRFWGTPHFWVAVPARIAVTLWSLACLSFCRRMAHFSAVERICFAWQLVTAVGVAFLVSSRSDIAIFVLVMLPLIFYLVVPTSFRGNVGGGLGCAALLLIGYLAPDPFAPTAPGMVMAVLVLHCGMWIAIARTNRIQRQEWTASRIAQGARAALAANSETLERMFMSVPIPLLVTRPDDGTIVRFNDAAARSFGTERDISRVHMLGEGESSLASLRERILNGQEVDNFECRIVAGDGAVHDVLLSSRPILIQDEACILSSIVDITDRKEAERHLAHLAMTDALTGLANRAHFMATLAQTSAAAGGGAQTAVVLIDVDEFKRINDSAGHDAGDALLRAVAERLQGAVRPGNLVARMGGDEFAVLLTGLRGATDLDGILHHMTDQLHQPVSHEMRDIECRVSMGVALFPDHAREIEQLMKYADIALYEAKNGGRGRACLFEPALLDHWQREARMLELARNALVHAPPAPWYQPKVDLATGAIIGFEALLRCMLPDGTVIMPGEIAAAFEQSLAEVPVGCAASPSRQSDHAFAFQARGWGDHPGVQQSLRGHAMDQVQCAARRNMGTRIEGWGSINRSSGSLLP